MAGLAIGTALGGGNLATLHWRSNSLFLFGYALAMLPLLHSGYRLGPAARIALAADTASIVVREIVDNLLMLAIPGATHC